MRCHCFTEATCYHKLAVINYYFRLNGYCPVIQTDSTFPLYLGDLNKFVFHLNEDVLQDSLNGGVLLRACGIEDCLLTP